jgi:hypothetical protein
VNRPVDPRWIDLRRFGASLEIVRNPTLRMRQLRLVINDRARWGDTIFGKPPAQFLSKDQVAARLAAGEPVAPEETQGGLKGRFEAALAALGFKEDPAESAERFVRAGGNGADAAAVNQGRPPVYYSDEIVPKRDKLRALIPAFDDYADSKPTSELSPNGAPFEWVDAASFEAAMRLGPGIHIRIDAESGRAVPCAPAEVPRFFEPIGHEHRFDRLRGNAKENNVLVDEAGWYAFHDVERGIQEVWTSAEDCARAHGLEDAGRESIRELILPYSVPVAYRETSHSVLVVPDARYASVDLASVAEGGLRALVLQRQALREVLTQVSTTGAYVETGVFAAGDNDDAVRDALVAVDSFLRKHGGKTEDAWKSRTKRYKDQLFGRDYRIAEVREACDRVFTVSDSPFAIEAIAHLRRLEKFGEKSRTHVATEPPVSNNALPDAHNRRRVIDEAVREALIAGLHYNDQLTRHVLSKLAGHDEAKTDAYLGMFDPVGTFEERMAHRKAVSEQVIAGPRGTWAVLRRVLTNHTTGEQNRYAYSALMAHGNEGNGYPHTYDASGTASNPADAPTFNRVYEHMVSGEISEAQKRVRVELGKELDAQAASALRTVGLVVGTNFKNLQVDGYKELSTLTVKAINFDECQVTFEAKEKGRQHKPYGQTVGAADFCKMIGVTPYPQEVWQLSREEWFNDVARVRKDVGASHPSGYAAHCVKVSYAYIDPSPAGPTHGSLIQKFTAHPEVGGEIAAPFGRARITTVHKMTGEVAIDLGELFELAKAHHRRVVSDAVSAGKPVPEKVLADYPGMLPKPNHHPVMGERIRFIPSADMMWGGLNGKYDRVIEGLVVDVQKTTGGNWRVRVREDRTSPTDGGPLEPLVYTHEGRIELVAEAGHVVSPADTVTEEQTTKRRTQRRAADADRIDDVGEKIGGARKDFSANRLTVADLDTMNDLERRELVIKKNIWPGLDYSAMRENGVTADAAYVIKWIKDKINVNPPRGDHVAAYITAVSIIRDELEDAKTTEEVTRACERIRTRFADTEPECADYSYTSKSKQMVAIGRDASALVCDQYKALYKAGRRTKNGESWDHLIKTVEKRKGEEGDAEKYRPERPHLDRLQRDGHDWRQGRDVTGDEMLSTFGFRAIEYGNWLPQDERQLVLNHGYDAFMDLAHTLKLPAAAMSFDGELAIAFGARGRFAAHFEPGRFVVNMTRIRGAGSLAHEWAHALDRWLAIKSRANQTFLTEVTRDALGSLDASTSSAIPFADLMGKLQSEPVPIEAAIEAQQRIVASNVSRAMEQMFAYATHDMYTGFESKQDGRLGGSYQRSVKALLDDVSKLFCGDAFFGKEQMTTAHRAYVDAAVPDRIVDLYKLHNGKRRAFHGKILTQIGLWFMWPTPAMKRLEHFEEARAQGCRYAPEGRQIRAGDELDNVVQRGTDFLQSAKALDMKRSSSYYSLPEELFARAFEAYVFDTIATAGGRSDYLVHGVEQERYAGPAYAGNPYPTGTDRQRFNAGFDAAVAALTKDFEQRVEKINDRDDEPALAFG